MVKALVESGRPWQARIGAHNRKDLADVRACWLGLERLIPDNAADGGSMMVMMTVYINYDFSQLYERAPTEKLEIASCQSAKLKEHISYMSDINELGSHEQSCNIMQ
ncbi:hypothetical protein PoB_007168200 [Plakobranchus ocellatus]|uniref:Uncharacterized protein n=1 Tax=Plakobranchus ocellatus TaxID=259542 RepID=A0AAV4DLP2_9GAST|nr:hypothetical protein PoB_007168200 [Plakobranchus ocellatus]